MSTETAKVLRSGKVLTSSLPHSPIENTNLSSNSNMESSSNSADEINRSGRNSPTNEDSTQSKNEERFNRLHDEMSMLKAMMEKIISQNEERDNQNGGSTATSSYAVGTSINHSGIWQQLYISDILMKNIMNEPKVSLVNPVFVSLSIA